MIPLQVCCSCCELRFGGQIRAISLIPMMKSWYRRVEREVSELATLGSSGVWESQSHYLSAVVHGVHPQFFQSGLARLYHLISLDLLILTVLDAVGLC